MNYYQGVPISKKENEWIKWFEQGTDQWQDAFAQYQGRRIAKKWSHHYELRAKTWFNKVLKSLREKGLFNHCPYAFLSVSGLYWSHPGFENPGFVAETSESKIVSYGQNKPII